LDLVGVIICLPEDNEAVFEQFLCLGDSAQMKKRLGPFVARDRERMLRFPELSLHIFGLCKKVGGKIAIAEVLSLRP